MSLISKARRRMPTVLVLVWLLGACAAPSGAPPLSGSAVPARPGSVPRPDHIVVVVEENHSYANVIGQPDAPYINALAAHGAVLTKSFAVAHPSQPNYLALFSGSTQGVNSDACPQTFTAPSLAGQLAAAGHSFGGYSEGLPATGFTGCSHGSYARKHNPWADFPAVPAAANQDFGAFPRDFSKLPTVSFVIPDLDNDMHDGSVATGDAWLRDRLNGYVQWAGAHHSILILTWDEDDDSAGNQIPTVIVGAGVKPGSYGEPVTHYSVLRTIEEALGLPALGNAAHTAPITDIWTVTGGGS